MKGMSPEHRDLDRLQRRRAVPDVLVGREDLAVEEARQTDREHVEHDAHDDLVDEVVDREHREQQPEEQPRDRRRDEAEPDVLRQARHDRGEEGAEQQLALDGDVDDAGPLAQDTRQRAEDQGHREQQRSLQQARPGESCLPATAKHSSAMIQATPNTIAETRTARLFGLTNQDATEISDADQAEDEAGRLRRPHDVGQLHRLVAQRQVERDVDHRCRCRARRPAARHGEDGVGDRRTCDWAAPRSHGGASGSRRARRR